MIREGESLRDESDIALCVLACPFANLIPYEQPRLVRGKVGALASKLDLALYCFSMAMRKLKLAHQREDKDGGTSGPSSLGCIALGGPRSIRSNLYNFAP